MRILRRILGPLRAVLAAIAITLGATRPLVAQPAPHPAASEADSLDALYSAMMAFRVLPFVTAARVTKLGIPRELLEMTRRDFEQKLDDAGEMIPGDRWILGQRLRWVLSAGGYPAAETLSDPARAMRGGVASLGAYVAAKRGQLARADTMFLAAVPMMPVEQRCEWANVAESLPDSAAVAAMDCAARDSLAARVWGLADPLYLTAGNERRVEHFVRWTFLKLEGDFRASDGGDTHNYSLESVTQGADLSYHNPADPFLPYLRRVVIRLGPPQAWAKNSDPRTMFEAYAPVLPATSSAACHFGNYPLATCIRTMQQVASLFVFDPGEAFYDNKVPRFHFLASMAATTRPLEASDADWTLDDLSAPELYHPPLPDVFVPLDHQIAYFRRGDSAYLVAAADIRVNRTLTQGFAVRALDPVVGMLAMTSDPSKPPDLWAAEADPVFRWAITVPTTRALIGIEAVTPHAAGRARYSAGPLPGPSQRVGISDLLMLETPQSRPPLSLEGAIPLVAGHTRVPEGGRAGFMWEVYGLLNGDSVTYSLGARRTDTPGPLSGVLRAIGLVGATVDATHIIWKQAITESADRRVDGVTLSVAGLSTGTYTLELIATVPGQQPVTASQMIHIVKR